MTINTVSVNVVALRARLGLAKRAAGGVVPNAGSVMPRALAAVPAGTAYPIIHPLLTPRVDSSSVASAAQKLIATASQEDIYDLARRCATALSAQCSGTEAFAPQSSRKRWLTIGVMADAIVALDSTAQRCEGVRSFIRLYANHERLAGEYCHEHAHDQITEQASAVWQRLLASLDGTPEQSALMTELIVNPSAMLTGQAHESVPNHKSYLLYDLVRYALEGDSSSESILETTRTALDTRYERLIAVSDEVSATEFQCLGALRLLAMLRCASADTSRFGTECQAMLLDADSRVVTYGFVGLSLVTPRLGAGALEGFQSGVVAAFAAPNADNAMLREVVTDRSRELYLHCGPPALGSWVDAIRTLRPPAGDEVAQQQVRQIRKAWAKWGV